MWSETLPYRKYREHYAPKFFPAAATALNAEKHHRLLDVACGTGTLAFGLAPYVGSVAGLDNEEPMLDAARAESKRRDIDAQLVCAGIEAAPASLGIFDIVTMGKAHWYLPQKETWKKLDELLGPGGRILICYTSTHDGLSGRWAHIFRHVRKDGYRLTRPRITPAQFMAGSGFVLDNSFRALGRHQISMKELLLRVLAFPGSTPKALGAQKNAYLTKIRNALAPHAVGGKFTEVIQSTGDVFVRR